MLIKRAALVMAALFVAAIGAAVLRDSVAGTAPRDVAGQAPATILAPVKPSPSVVPTSVVHRMGEAVLVGAWDVTVEKVFFDTDFDWSGIGNIQRAKGIFVEVFATARNVSNRTARLNASDWAIVDTTGALYDACTELGCFSFPAIYQREALGASVPPRTSAKLIAIFDVAADVAGLGLVIGQSTVIKLSTAK